MKETWQDRLEQAIDEAQMTKKELADRMGYSGAAIRHWFIQDPVDGKKNEKKPRRTPRLKEFEQVAEILGVSANWLIFGWQEVDTDYLTRCFKAVRQTCRRKGISTSDDEKIKLATKLYSEYPDRPAKELLEQAESLLRGAT